MILTPHDRIFYTPYHLRNRFSSFFEIYRALSSQFPM